MIHKQHSPINNCVRIIFQIPSSIWADKIALVGNFNEWDPNVNPLHQSRDGSWKTALDLPKGTQYEFSYWIDGDWRAEFDANSISTITNGVPRSVLNI